MHGHSREEAVTNKELKFQSGGVVQLVRTPASDAGELTVGKPKMQPFTVSSFLGVPRVGALFQSY